MAAIKKGTVGGKKAPGPKVKEDGEIPRLVMLAGRVQASRHDPSFGQRDRRRGKK